MWNTVRGREVPGAASGHITKAVAGSSGTPAAHTHNALRRVCVESAVGERVLHAQELVVGLLGPTKVRVVHGGFDVAG
jgi:hypothetical protein